MTTPRPPHAPVLRVEGLTKAYGPLRAVDGVSFSLPAATVVALLGPNGAGKTTTFKCILGVTGFEGAVEVDGLCVKARGPEVRRRLGYLPQVPAFGEGDTCRGVLRFLADLKGAEPSRVELMLRRVDLWDQRDVKVGHLSGGMRQRLALAAALLADPPLLLLDEPTANLDQESRRRFYDLVRQLRDEGKTIVLSTHFVDGIAALADRVIVLRRGRLVFDGPAQETLRKAQPNRFLVRLNGSSPEAFLEALRAAGIKAADVEPAPAHWEELAAEPDQVGKGEP